MKPRIWEEKKSVEEVPLFIRAMHDEDGDACICVVDSSGEPIYNGMICFIDEGGGLAVCKGMDRGIADIAGLHLHLNGGIKIS